ncbi:uncharacterized protein [Dysidea avara]|uniref:uncharacterized protein n=1 Tax=Dysidea avara TaxID=196820 RepID=UPI00332447DE
MYNQSEYRCFSVLKLGLEPNEYKEALNSKLIALMSHEMEQRFKGTLPRIVKLCLQSVCIKPKITRPEELDRRRRSNVLYKRVLLLYDERGLKRKRQSVQYSSDKTLAQSQQQSVSALVELGASPMKLLEQTSGHQGTRVHYKVVNKKYHEDQSVLLALLPELLQIHVTPESSDLKLTETEKFCCLIDNYTVILMDFCKNLTCRNCDIPSPDQLLLLGIILILCERVVMGRQVADWEVSNDLMSVKGWRRWKDHVQVMISFTAMWTILLMVFTLLKRNWKQFREIVKIHADLDTLISEIFHYYGWSWPHPNNADSTDYYSDPKFVTRVLMFWSLILLIVILTSIMTFP